MFTEVARGEQALVGFLKVPNCEAKFLKVSRDIDFSAQHEHTIATAISEKAHLRANFLRINGMHTIYVDDVIRLHEQEEVVHEPTTDSIPKMTLDMEYIKDSISLNDWIILHKATLMQNVFPLIRQVMAIVRQAQESLDFCHYDLHIENVLLVPSARTNQVDVYRFKNGEELVTRIGLVEPIIIDFGRAYCNALENTPVNVELMNTQCGIFSVTPQYNFDPLFFMNSCAKQLKNHAGYSKLDTKLKPFTKHLEEYGWWDNKEMSALEHAASLVRAMIPLNTMFSDHLDSSLIILSHLCIIPLERNADAAKYWTYYFGKFVTQWSKCERWFRSVARAQYFLCFVTSTLNIYRVEYLEPASRNNAIQQIISEFNAFMNVECNNQWALDGLDWSELIRCAYLAGRMLEGFIAEIIEDQRFRYTKLVEGAIFNTLVTMIPDEEIVVAKESRVTIKDSITEKIT